MHVHHGRLPVPPEFFFTSDSTYTFLLSISKMTKIAIVGGTSLLTSSLFSKFQPETIETPHGKVIIYSNDKPDKIYFLQRHHADGDAGAEVYNAPHNINHRANFCALFQLKVDAVLSICSVGSLHASIVPGTLVVPDDYFYMHGPSFSYYDDGRAHIVPSLDEAVRKVIVETVTEAEFERVLTKNATYVQTVGPRFETPAEVRYLSSAGHIVGMTAANEATAARELKLKYAVLAMVDNFGNGLADSNLSYTDFKETVNRNCATIEKAVTLIIDRLSQASL